MRLFAAATLPILLPFEFTNNIKGKQHTKCPQASKYLYGGAYKLLINIIIISLG